MRLGTPVKLRNVEITLEDYLTDLGAEAVTFVGGEPAIDGRGQGSPRDQNLR